MYLLNPFQTRIQDENVTAYSRPFYTILQKTADASLMTLYRQNTYQRRAPTTKKILAEGKEKNHIAFIER